MGRIRKTNEPHEGNPEDLVQAFAPASNFPKERAGVLALAQALRRAADDFHIAMTDIVRECSDVSSWCPTAADIRNVARSMRDAIRNRQQKSLHAEWERIYGPPDPDWSAKLLKLAVGAPHEEQMAAMHDYAVRCVLFYTEGDGIRQGDREFWEGSANVYGAGQYEADHYPARLAKTRTIGGWRTERELQEQLEASK